MSSHAMKRRVLLAGSLVVLGALGALSALLLVFGGGGEPTAQAAANRTPQAQTIIQAEQLAPAPPSAQPTGWETDYSQRLGIKLLATYDSSGPPAWDPVRHPLVFVTSVGPGYGRFLSTNKLPGMWAVVSTKTWEPVKYYKGGYDPIWTAFSPDGQYAYQCDGGSDEVWKVDHKQRKVLGASRSAVHGGYGCHVGWKANELWIIEKGEASHNRGKNIGLVDVLIMRPMDNFNTGWIRADHGAVHPNPEVNELWVTANSSFEVVVWDLGKRQVKARIPMPMHASTHSGAFVQYDPDFTGQVLSDQNGLHGPALEKQRELWLAAAR